MEGIGKVRMKRKISRDSSQIKHKKEENGEEEIDHGDGKKVTDANDFHSCSSNP